MMDNTSSQVQSLVSVVIPLYNKSQYIERALSSVLSQTYPPLEIIVINDGSTDDGPEKVIASNNPMITFVKQENRGSGTWRNAIARGKYIAFPDADDEWFPTFIEAGLPLLPRMGRAVLNRHMVWRRRPYVNQTNISSYIAQWRFSL
jgi:glycosyltransferase involved in cell wall biosynthesis